MQACVAELNQSNDTVEKFVAHSSFLKSTILGGNKAKHKCVKPVEVRLSLSLFLLSVCPRLFALN